MKKSMLGILVILLLLFAGFISVGLFSNSKSTGNVIANPDDCANVVVGGVSYNASSNSYATANQGLLCFQGTFYRCGVLSSALNTQFTTTRSFGQQVGSWKCAALQQKWTSESNCVANLTTHQFYALNNSFGYYYDSGTTITQDYNFYCLNGGFSDCGGTKNNSLLAAKIYDNDMVGNYKCFNSSGVSRFFYSNSSCVGYYGTNFYWGTDNTVGLQSSPSKNLLNLTVIQTDNRYLCTNNTRYYCNTTAGSGSFASIVANQTVVANSWKCNNDNSWLSVTPTITSAVLSCNCSNSCGPFTFGLVRSNAFNFDVSLIYSLANGSNVSSSASVSPTIQGNIASGSYSFNVNCNQGSVVNGITLKVKNSDSLLGSQAYSTLNLNVGAPSCSNECPTLGVNQCSGNGYQTCGNYDSDPCLEWSGVTTCGVGTYCISGACSLPQRTDTCTPVGGLCSSALVSNSNVSVGDCPFVSQNCFKCNAGYLWNGSECKSTSCQGNYPIIGNASVGSNFTTSSSLANWTYVLASSSLGSCQWSCNPGFRLNLSTNLSCIEGKYSCSELGGVCSNTTLTLGIVNINAYGNCSTATDSCIKCDSSAGYLWNGSACIQILSCNDSDGGLNYYVKGFLNTSASPGTSFEDYCLDSTNLIERHCLSANPNNFTVQYPCPNGCLNGACVSTTPGRTCPANKCLYNNSCLGEKFRLNGQYCNGISFVSQKAVNESCSNDYECATSFCAKPEGKCLDLGQEVINARGFLANLWCWIKSGFNRAAISYATC